MSPRRNWLLVAWACAKIGHSLAEHARKLVTPWLSICKNHYCIGAQHIQSNSVPSDPSSVPFYRPISNSYVNCITSLFLVSSSPVTPVFRLFLVPLPLSPVSRLCSLPPVRCPHAVSPLCSYSCLPSAVPALRLCSLSPVLCRLSHVSVPCLPSSVHCLTWSFPWLPFCFLPPINCPSVHFSVALVNTGDHDLLFLCSSVSVPPSSVLCSLSFVLARMLRVFLG
jgi:hypothetical protein